LGRPVREEDDINSGADDEPTGFEQDELELAKSAGTPLFFAPELCTIGKFPGSFSYSHRRGLLLAFETNRRHQKNRNHQSRMLSMFGLLESHCSVSFTAASLLMLLTSTRYSNVSRKRSFTFLGAGFGPRKQNLIPLTVGT
jgi:hypothetical protein